MNTAMNHQESNYSSRRTMNEDVDECKEEYEEYDTKSLLAELIAVSNQNASSSRFQSSTPSSSCMCNSTKKIFGQSSCGSSTALANEEKQTEVMNKKDENQNYFESKHGAFIKSNSDDGQRFVDQHMEKAEMNQYWYSPATIQVLCDAIIEIVSKCTSRVTSCAGTNSQFKIAFLSTPSLYFAIPVDFRKYCNIFDIDNSAFEHDNGFVHYNFEEPDNIPTSLHHKYDMVVIDPPFVTRGVWELYKKATNVLLKRALMTKYEGDTNFSSDHKSFILATTIAENEPLMKELFNARPTIFKPTIPHLTYQYNVYVNCRDECEKLKTKNLELI